MPTATMRNVSGPTTRKTMESVRRASNDDGETKERSSFVATKKIYNSSGCNMEERSVNSSTLSYADGDDLIDSDNSESDNYTEDEEPLTRENTPVSFRQESVRKNRSEVSPPRQVTPQSEVSFQRHGVSVETDSAKRNKSACSARNRKAPLKHAAPPEVSYIPKRLLIEQEVETTGNNYVAFTFVIALMLLAVGLIYKSFLNREPPRTPAEKSPALARSVTCEGFYSLEESYKNIDDTLWDALLTSFVRANAVQQQQREPGTFLFLHNGSTKMVNRFMEQVTHITADCFGGTQPILLDSKYFKRADIAQDFGEFQSQQTDALRKQGIMVVRNLEDVPPKAAQAFHSICDPEEPLVDKAIIYFTLDTSKITTDVVPTGRSATDYAEKVLYHLWRHVLQPEVLDPLIVRLTENVYRIV